MRHPRIIIASITLAAAAAIGGGVTAAAATTSHASSPPAASQQAAATVRTAQATVGGKTETILVNSAGPAAVLLPERHRGEVGRHRRAGGAVAAADIRVTGRHRADRQAHRGHGHPRRPGRLQRPPAVHLRRRPGRPGDRPGSPGLLRGHPRPHPDHRLPDSNRARPRPRPPRPATLSATETARRPRSAGSVPSGAPVDRGRGLGQADMTITRLASAGMRRTWFRPASQRLRRARGYRGNAQPGPGRHRARRQPSPGRGAALPPGQFLASGIRRMARAALAATPPGPSGEPEPCRPPTMQASRSGGLLT